MQDPPPRILSQHRFGRVNRPYFYRGTRRLFSWQYDSRCHRFLNRPRFCKRTRYPHAQCMDEWQSSTRGALVAKDALACHSIVIRKFAFFFLVSLSYCQGGRLTNPHIRVQPILALWFNAERLLLALRQDPEVARLAALYLKYLSIELPAYAFNNTLRCVHFSCLTFGSDRGPRARRYFQAQGLFSVPTKIIVIAAPINALLNYLLGTSISYNLTCP